MIYTLVAEIAVFLIILAIMVTASVSFFVFFLIKIYFDCNFDFIKKLSDAGVKQPTIVIDHNDPVN